MLGAGLSTGAGCFSVIGWDADKVLNRLELVHRQQRIALKRNEALPLVLGRVVQDVQVSNTIALTKGSFDTC